MKSFTASMNAFCISPAISLSCSQAAIGPSVIKVLTSVKVFSILTTTVSPITATICLRMFWYEIPIICRATLTTPLKSQVCGKIKPSRDPVSHSNNESFKCFRKFFPKFLNPVIAAFTRFLTNCIGFVNIALSTAAPLLMMASILSSE